MILVAPTAFKGTHSAADVAAALTRGVRAATDAEACALPVSDGGPGLIDALVAGGWKIAESVAVTGPLGTPVLARIAAQGRVAAVESADACGLALVPADERDPLRVTSYGVGELLAHASARYERVYVGLGGSATIDCGLGAAAALGWRLQDACGAQIERTGRGLLSLDRIAGGPTKLARITALADVTSPLFGSLGAAHVFGPQKGASEALIDVLDAGLEKAAAIIRRDIGIDVARIESGGAAGGLGAGLHAFAGADLVSGSEWVLAQLHFDELLARASLLITGEGSFDAQSAMGKITGELIRRAGTRGVPVLLIAGRIEGDLPAHVRAVGSRQLDLTDIERLTSESLPQLLAP